MNIENRVRMTEQQLVTENQLLDMLQIRTPPVLREAGDLASRLYYRNAQQQNAPRKRVPNPPYDGDIIVGATEVQLLYEQIAKEVEKHGYAVRFLTEELSTYGYKGEYEARVKPITYEQILSFAEFFDEKGDFDYILRCLSDPIDGTEVLNSQREDWSTALVYILRNLPRLTMMYEPARGLLTSACLKSYRGTLRGEIHIKHMLSGTEMPVRTSVPAHLDKAAVGYHITRNNENKRKAFLDQLNKIAPQCRTTFAIGCGSVACREIATGQMDAYFCNWVPLHDALIAVPIITAIGGKITQYDGSPIEPTSKLERVSLIAAATPQLHKELKSNVS